MPEKYKEVIKQMPTRTELLVCSVSEESAQCLPVEEISEFLMKTRKPSKPTE